MHNEGKARYDGPRELAQSLTAFARMSAPAATWNPEGLRMNRRTNRALLPHGEAWEFERRVLSGLVAGFMALFVAGAFGMSPMLRSWYVFSATGLAIARLYFASPEGAPPAGGGDRGHGIDSHQAHGSTPRT